MLKKLKKSTLKEIHALIHFLKSHYTFFALTLFLEYLSIVASSHDVTMSSPPHQEQLTAI